MGDPNDLPFETDPGVVERCIEREAELRKRANLAWAMGNKDRSNALHREASIYARAIGYDFVLCIECTEATGHWRFIRRVDRAAHVHQDRAAHVHQNPTTPTVPPASAPR